MARRNSVDWRTKIALVVVVVGVGLAVALQFRKHGGAVSEASAAAADTVSKPAMAQDTAPFGSKPLDHLAESTPASAPAGGAESSESNHSNAGRPAADMVDLNAPQQTHKVVDGDTLPQLAQQYLGRADRYLEIFEYNRDVLESPDVLPIGAELRMPSRFAAPAGDSATTKDAVPPAATASASAPPLVPLVSPTVKPATVAKKPRTYTVQRGDNLVDIARKMYGDGRHYQDLFEANRGVMHYPGDLRPGHGAGDSVSGQGRRQKAESRIPIRD